MSEVKTLSFYTIGSDFTRMVRDLFSEGAFYNAYTILRTGGMEDSMIRNFFMNSIKLEGDTREDDSLSVVEDTPMSEEEFTATIIVALRTLISFEDMYFQDVFLIDKNYEFEDNTIHTHLACLFKIFPKSMLLSMCLPAIFNDAGYDIVEGCGPNFNGVITQDGKLIECGYQEHNDLYPFLFKFGMSSDTRWTDCNTTIHISSGQASGSLAHSIQHWDERRNDKTIVSKAMLKTLRDNCNNISFYGYGRKKMMQVLSKFYEKRENKGGKYGKLTFLKECYPEVNLPKFSLSEIPDVKNCIRTSPKRSIAGLLNSKFDIDSNSIKEIEEDFEQYKDVVSDNELHYFYQEYLEGVNGVAHCRDKIFTYSCSETRGNIVDGKKGDYELNFEHKRELIKILEILHKDLDKDIQVEFVVSNNKLYIVQLRLLEDAREYRSYTINHKDIIVSGHSFSMQRSEELSIDDVLIIDNDCESEAVIGKKAIIVREETEFSHALALSYSLGIPSIYNVGDNFKLPEKFIVDTRGRDGYILKID